MNHLKNQIIYRQNKITNIKTKCLIQMLSLQATIQSKIRLIADNFISYRKILNSFNQKIMFSDIFINKSTSYNNLNFSEKNMIILNLIKNTQEFNSQYK